jgi:rubrerythrin
MSGNIQNSNSNNKNNKKPNTFNEQNKATNNQGNRLGFFNMNNMQRRNPQQKKQAEQNQMQGVYNQIESQKRELIARYNTNTEMQNNNTLQTQPISNTMQIPQHLKNLPDGVKFEQLDENSLANTNKLKQVANLSQNKNKNSNSNDNNKKQDLDSKELESLIQNEKNGTLFYKHLSTLVKNEFHLDTLDKIAVSSDYRQTTYNDLYKKMNDVFFEPVDEAIQNNVTYKRGIEIAIREETNCLRKLNEMYKKSSEENSKIINSLIYDKVSDLSLLHLLNNA